MLSAVAPKLWNWNSADDRKMQHICVAADEEEIRRCYPVLKQLRLHLDESALVSQVIRQQAQGYFLVYLESENEIRSVAGYWFCENLSSADEPDDLQAIFRMDAGRRPIRFARNRAVAFHSHPRRIDLEPDQQIFERQSLRNTARFAV